MKTWSLIHALDPGRRGFATGGHWSLDWKLLPEGSFFDVRFHWGRHLVPDPFELALAPGVQQLLVPLNARVAAVFLHVAVAFGSGGEWGHVR